MRYAAEYGGRRAAGGGHSSLVWPLFSSGVVVVDGYTLCINIRSASLLWREKRIGERPYLCPISTENPRGLDRSHLSFVDKSVSFRSGCTLNDAYP